ncbi:tumor necrosis factor receptor superfamily member 1B-like isoform X2 [Hydractinia symbiolongicarpus]|uniref:tumor necrosis factor receptor superfamily member 1B-like isoform X2 n=1 Tax=Hydractinia symbiolongicarpus TaxID=13093 RepID=UPI0025505B88|nr:tumor necrosis factor receptor superfamily member 1B-like isoform X2 [Hydractinia symbiolongicarpus]
MSNIDNKDVGLMACKDSKKRLATGHTFVNTITMAVIFLTFVMTEAVELCPAEQYFDSLKNKCEPCTMCGREQIETRACSVQSDRVCECPPEHYYHLGRLFCDTCTVCDADYRIVRPCGKNTNTICQKCPQGLTTYGNNSRECIQTTTSSHQSGSESVGFRQQWLSWLLLFCLSHLFFL